MQRLLFAKVEFWLVLFLLLLGILGTILFGSVVLHGERHIGPKGKLARTAIALAEMPDTARQLLSEDTQIEVSDSRRFAALQPGWNPTAGATAMPALPGYLLLSRYDGTRRRHVIELVSLADWQVSHAWAPDADVLLQGAARTSKFAPFEDWNTNHFRAIHPLLLPNGDLIIKDHDSPLLRIDACAARVWMQDANMFHHSTESDADGMLWVPGRAEPAKVARVSPEFLDDEVVEVDPADGRELFTRSVAQLLLDNGMIGRLFTNGAYVDDPIHLNDIQPVLADGPWWKKGDLFLSLRNISAIMLYRPSTDAIIWLKQGPWLSQHDVDILDDSRIAVYDNRAEDRGLGEYVETNSDVLVYDFATDQVTRLLGDAMARAEIKTLYAGLYTALPGGYSLIEDVTSARLVLIGPDGVAVGEYANKADSGKVFHLGWSRYLTQVEGDTALAAIGAKSCPAE